MASYKRLPLKPFPNGWYVLAESKELAPKQILTRRFVGKDVVIFRTESGAVAISEAYCPHMGGHLGHGGVVEGENIKCPFHHFCFDNTGTCTATGYGTKPSSKLRLPMLHSLERNGFILAWYDEKNNAPDFDIPFVDPNGYTEVATTDFLLTSHPQETTENSVDIGHFSIVHGYSGVDTLREMDTRGRYLNAKYVMHRQADFLGKKEVFRTEFEVHVHGLGYSFVETYVPTYDMYTRQYVLSTPTDHGKVNLKIGMSIKHLDDPGKILFLLKLFPKKMITNLILKTAFKGYCQDVGQDFKIWENKIYIDPPLLAKGDGPVAQYRMWASQFYYEDSTQPNLYPANYYEGILG